MIDESLFKSNPIPMFEMKDVINAPLITGLESEFIDFKTLDESKLKLITTGAALNIEGLLVKSIGSGQKVELNVNKLDIIGNCDPEKYPIQPKKHSFEFLRENAHLRIRTSTFGAIMRIRSKLSYAVHKFFQEENFQYVNTPIITSNDAEGAGEMFRVTTLNAKSPPLVKNNVDFTKLEPVVVSSIFPTGLRPGGKSCLYIVLLS